MSAGEKGIDDAIDRRVRNRERRASREGGAVHAEDAAVGVDERAAGEAVVDREVEPHEPVDLTAAPGAPPVRHGADDTEAGADAFVAGPADGEYESAHAEGVGGRERRERHRLS